MSVNREQACFNMVEQQIRTWNVLEPSVLDLITSTPRDLFIPAEHKDLAFADLAIPLAHNQQMLHPKVEAHILQAVKVKPTDSVLEVGTGAAYLSACLAKQCANLHSIDIYPDFIDQAKDKLISLDIHNVSLECKDIYSFINEHKRFDVVVITGSIPVEDDRFKTLLSVGGRLFIIVGQSPAMQAMVITRVSESNWQTKELFETDVPALLNAKTAEKFEF